VISPREKESDPFLVTPLFYDCPNKVMPILALGTDHNPSVLSWELKNLRSNETVWSSSSVSYTAPFFQYVHTNCFEKGTYKFTIYNSAGDGIWHRGFYMLYVNYKLLKKTLGPVAYYSQSTIFGICSSTDECDDNDSCTIDRCILGQCSFEVSNCSECGKTKVEIEVRTDKFPNDKNWEVIDYQTKQQLWSNPEYEKTKQFTVYNHAKCFSDGTYSLRYVNHYVRGIEEGGYFSLFVNDVLLKSVTGITNFFLEETKFDICSTDDDCHVDDACTTSHCNKTTKQCVSVPTFNTTCGVFGKKTLIALRIVTLDAETTESLNELRDYIFGTQGKNFTVTSQILACSYNALNIIPFSGLTKSGQNISNGVAEVQLFINATGRDAGAVADATIFAANELYGDLVSQFDLVMVCLPPGTVVGSSTGWTGYAYMNHYLSVYNDGKCREPPIQIHEIGHNIGLSHSDSTINYGDLSCQMGASPSLLGKF